VIAFHLIPLTCSSVTEVMCSVQTFAHAGQYYLLLGELVLSFPRPYLIFGIEEAVKEAQKGGSGVVIYFRKEGRALGEVTKVSFRSKLSLNMYID
jgi:hypothetical protein